MKDYVLSVTKEYGFPPKAIADLPADYEKIEQCEKANVVFKDRLSRYEQDHRFDYNEAIDRVEELCEWCGVRVETGSLLFILCLTKQLKRLYEINHFEKERFDGVLGDILAKTHECLRVRNVCGTFVAGWFIGFFNLTRFAVGRLQFEPYTTETDLHFEHGTLAKGSSVINVHIPSGAPLETENCRKSFEDAYRIFAPQFQNGTVPFFCASWLLAPEHRQLLGENSNIVRFMDLFHIIPSERTAEHDFWRIFGREDCSDADTLPTGTALQKAYVSCIRNGHIPAAGYGILYMKDGKITDPFPTGKPKISGVSGVDFTTE